MGEWVPSMGSKLKKLWVKLYSRAYLEKPDRHTEYRKEFSEEAAASDVESINALGKLVADVCFSRARLDLAQRIGNKLRDLEASGARKSFQMLMRVSVSNMNQADQFIQILLGVFGLRGNSPKFS